jgi:uncharacterized protein
VSADYTAEVEEFRARRDAKYRSAEGWLTLVDRLWLRPGDNATPLGTIRVEGERVWLSPVGAPPVTRGGAPLTSPIELTPPGPGRPSEALEQAGRRYELGQLRGDFNLRVRDPAAPARAAFTGIPVYPIEPAWRVVARFDRSPPGSQVVHDTSDGAEEVMNLVGIAIFEVAGVPCRLECYFEDSSRRLHVPFADLTNRVETYGGGRFLYAEPDGDDRVVLDFNKAFNPPCAFNALVICPLPPAQNHLAVAVRAGERAPAVASAA